MHIIFSFDPCVKYSSSYWGAPSDVIGTCEEIESFSNFLSSSLFNLREHRYSVKIIETGRCFVLEKNHGHGFAVSFESADIVLNYLEVSGHTWEIRENNE